MHLVDIRLTMDTWVQAVTVQCNCISHWEELAGYSQVKALFRKEINDGRDMYRLSLEEFRTACTDGSEGSEEAVEPS